MGGDLGIRDRAMMMKFGIKLLKVGEAGEL